MDSSTRRFVIRLTTTLALVVALGTGCYEALDPELQPIDVMTYPVVEGSVEAVGLLDLLNDAATTFDVLDNEVPLDRRAAGNIIAHRDGGDRLFDTTDDDLFGSVEELDSVRWVGARSIIRIANYAAVAGWVPQGEDVLGTWDRVQFTVEEADLTLDLVNSVDHYDLDIEFGLNRRAADSIVNAQPVVSIAHLAGLYYVGRSALETLKANIEVEEEEVELCSPSLTSSEFQSATDLSTLLEMSTFTDTPWAEVNAFSASGCEDWSSDSAAADAFTQVLWDATFHINWSELSDDYRLVDGFVPGGNQFISRVEQSLLVIDERIEDGDWDPTADPAGQELYNSRYDLLDQLSLDIAENPGAFLEQHLYFDMLECSEAAVALYDTRTGFMLLIHEFSRC